MFKIIGKKRLITLNTSSSSSPWLHKDEKEILNGSSPQEGEMERKVEG